MTKILRAEVWCEHSAGGFKMFVWGARSSLPVWGMDYSAEPDRMFYDLQQVMLGKWSPEGDNGSELPDHDTLAHLRADYARIVQDSGNWSPGKERGWALAMSTIEDVGSEDWDMSMRSAYRDYHTAYAQKGEV